MAGVVIESFSNLEVAQAFFKNVIEESPDLDGVFVKTALRTAFSKNNGPAEILGGGDELYLVLALPKGTGIQIDTTSPAAVSPSVPLKPVDNDGNNEGEDGDTDGQE
uniref:hypothetical protein n=1 Tax=Parerythrobacter lutipelagi TaxID=1964208 RepID=UPI0010F74579|nr:hypothetical protein [Parerythrobacter lutipelagi]